MAITEGKVKSNVKKILVSKRPNRPPPHGVCPCPSTIIHLKIDIQKY